MNVKVSNSSCKYTKNYNVIVIVPHDCSYDVKSQMYRLFLAYDV